MKVSTCRLLILMVTTFVLLQCKNDSDSKDDNESDGETLQVNPLAEAYPQGLSMAALSNENAGDNGTTSGALAIDDSSALATQLTNSFEDTFELATGTGLLGYDRSACEAYHQGLAADKQSSCACSHRQSRSNRPGEEAPADHDGASSMEKDVLGALFDGGKTRLDEANERLRGEDGVACFSKRLKKVVRAVLEASRGEGLYDVFCYEFDWGLEFPYRVSKSEDDLVEKEVCLVSFTRKEIAQTQAYLEFSTQMTQAMLCQAKKSGLATELSEGENIDLTTVLDELDQNTVEPTFAQISRLEDKAGAKVYQTRYTMNVTPPEGGGELEFDFTILHSPKGDDNKEYTGLLSFTHDLPERPGDETEKFKALSIAYSSEFESETDPRRVKMELRMGEIKEGRDPFVNGEVDFNAGAESDGSFALLSNLNQNLSNMKYVLYDGYPSEGVMNFSYWRNPGELYEENARGFIFNIERTQDNIVKGCAYAGASAATDVQSPNGMSIRKALKEGVDLEPKGFLRPFLCPYDPAAPDPQSYDWSDQANRDRRFGPRIWKQCFVQNSDGSYSIDKSKTNNKGFTFASAKEAGDFVAPPPPPPPPRRR